MAANYQLVRQMALALPGVTEGTSYGTPSLHVGRKLMARLREDGETLVVKVEPGQRAALLDAFPDAFFLTEHYRKYPWVLVHLPAVTLDRLRKRIEEAWRLVASRRLIVAFDQLLAT